MLKTPTEIEQSFEIVESRPTVSAPSTPTPLSREKQIEKEFIDNNENQTPEKIKEKKANKIITQKPDLQKKTRANSTTTDGRFPAKTLEKK